VVLPQQHRSAYLNLRLDPGFPLVDVFAAVHANADGNDSLAELVP
jgi:hypothetical protein